MSIEQLSPFQYLQPSTEDGCLQSPLLYLYRINALDWLPELFSEVWIPNAVVLELGEGKQRGYDVPVPTAYAWLLIVEPQSIPPELTTLDLGMGELAALTLALETPICAKYTSAFWSVLVWRSC